RAGHSPVLPFSQLNVRTYVTWKGEPAVLFLASRVTLAGLPGLLFGAPYRSARLRVKPGQIRAPGLGVELRYRQGGPDRARPRRVALGRPRRSRNSTPPPRLRVRSQRRAAARLHARDVLPDR